jgi:hypothetical protein
MTRNQIGQTINANKPTSFRGWATSICGRWMYFGTDREPDAKALMTAPPAQGK